MRKIIALLLATLLMLVASAAPVWAEDDKEDNEAGENEAAENSGEEKENSMPGFEFAFALAGALAAARMLRV